MSTLCLPCTQHLALIGPYSVGPKEMRVSEELRVEKVGARTQGSGLLSLVFAVLLSRE